MTAVNNIIGKQKGAMTYIDDYVMLDVLTGAGASGGNIDGPVIDNSDGSIKALFAQGLYTDDGGTSPTAQLLLMGSFFPDGSSPFGVVDSGGNAITSGSATDVSGASSADVVNSFQTTAEGVEVFPPYLFVRLAIGGTSTPTVAGRLMAAFLKRHPVTGL